MVVQAVGLQRLSKSKQGRETFPIMLCLFPAAAVLYHLLSLGRYQEEGRKKEGRRKEEGRKKEGRRRKLV